MATNYHINPSTNQWDDNYWANTGEKLAAMESGGGGGGGSSQDIANQLADQYVKNLPTPYEQAHPFSFDEALARQASTTEYSPYYNRLLSDYTSNIERQKSRSTEDLNKTLEFLGGGKDYFLGNERKMLDRAVDTSNKGFAGRGLFFSGAKQKDINQQQQDSTSKTNEYMRNYEYQKGGATTQDTRTQQDLATSLSDKSRDINQELKTGIEQGVLNRKGEAIQEYEMGKTKYYSQFPSYYYNLGMGS